MSPPTNTPLPTAQSTTSQNSPHETPVRPSLSTSFQGLSLETLVPTAPSTAFQESPHEVPKRLTREKYCQDQDEMISYLHTFVCGLFPPQSRGVWRIVTMFKNDLATIYEDEHSPVKKGTVVQVSEEKAKALLDTGGNEVDQWQDLALKENLAKLPQPADMKAAESMYWA